MRKYVVTTLDHGRIAIVATVHTAKHAIIKFLEAREQYEGVCVSDKAGNQLSFDDLTFLAAEEDKKA